MYGTLLIQFLNVCILSFFFNPKVHYQTINFLLAVNQPTIAKMDNFHFCNLLKEFQSSGSSMGSYLSDTVPQLTKHSFAIFTSVPSNDRGEAGLRLLDWIKITTLLILWKKRSTYLF